MELAKNCKKITCIADVTIPVIKIGINRCSKVVHTHIYWEDNGVEMFSSYLRKPTSCLNPFSKPASYNICKGLNGVTHMSELCYLSP